MSLFPQLSTGQVTSLPVTRSPFFTTLVNRSDDGTEIRFAELSQELGSWQIDLNNLPDVQAATLIAFFNANLKYGRFIFLDPFQNLLQYSEDFTQGVWTYSGSHIITPNPIPDPFGGAAASELTSTVGGNLVMKQQIAVGPASQTISPYPKCTFTTSLWLRAASANCTITLQVSDGISQVGALTVKLPGGGGGGGDSWTRYAVTYDFISSASSTLEFDLIIPSGLSVFMFGAQLMYLPGMGDYTKTTTVTGVRPVCRFDADVLPVTGTTYGANKIVVPVIELVG